MNYLIRLGDALSQFFNVLLFNGDPNHSISGDAYRFRRERLRRVIDCVFSPFEKDHCRKAHLHDVEKACRLCSGWGCGDWPAPVTGGQRAGNKTSTS